MTKTAKKVGGPVPFMSIIGGCGIVIGAVGSKIFDTCRNEREKKNIMEKQLHHMDYIESLNHVTFFFAANRKTLEINNVPERTVEFKISFFIRKISDENLVDRF